MMPVLNCHLPLHDLESQLITVVRRSKSINEIMKFFRSCSNVESANCRNYFLKSNPPQRVFSIQCRGSNELTFQLTLRIIEFSGQKFEFHSLEIEQ